MRDLKTESINLFNKTISELPEDYHSSSFFSSFEKNRRILPYPLSVDSSKRHHKINTNKFVDIWVNGPFDALNIIAADYYLPKYLNKKSIDFETVSNILKDIVKEDYFLFPIYSRNRIKCLQIACNLRDGNNKIYAIKEVMAYLGYLYVWSYIRRNDKDITGFNSENNGEVIIYEFFPMEKIISMLKKELNGLEELNYKPVFTWKTEDYPVSSSLEKTEEFIDGDYRLAILNRVFVGDTEEEISKINLKSIKEIYKNSDIRLSVFEFNKPIIEKWLSSKEHKFWSYIGNN